MMKCVVTQFIHGKKGKSSFCELKF